MKTYTFISDHKCIRVTVKEEFLHTIESKPEDIPFWKLFYIHEMKHYLHNKDGPALESLVNDYKSYWINGEQIK